MANYGYKTVNTDFDDYFITKESFDDSGFNPSSLFVWGDNSFGQLGINDTFNRSSPVQTLSFGGWKDVAAGGYFVLGIKSDGSLWSWGYGSVGYGQGRSSPGQIGGTNSKWIKISAGHNTARATSSNGRLHSGSSGTGFTQDGFPNVSYRMMSSGSEGTVGDHALYITISGTLLGSGSNVWSQLGNTSTEDTWSYVSAGSTWSHAIKTDGTLWATGNNIYGQLGDNTNTNRTLWTQIGSDTNWKQVSGSKNLGTRGAFTIAIKTDGTLWATGNNMFGQFGIDPGPGDPITGLPWFRSSPVQVGSSTNWKQVSTGQSHTVAIKTDGTLWSWGRNDRGQIGNNTITDRSSPTQIGSGKNWRQVSCGVINTYALASNQNYS